MRPKPRTRRVKPSSRRFSMNCRCREVNVEFGIRNAEFRMKKEIPRGRSGNSPRMLLNVDGVENSTLGQRHPSFVPQGHLRIARRFNAGLAGYETQVPKGRLTGAQHEVLSPTPVLD